MRAVLLGLVAAALALPGPCAADIATAYPQVRTFFPDADRFGELEGAPPAAPVYRGGELVGYAFLTNDVVRIPAYSGKPINTLVGFDLAGRITGLEIVHHEEPILAAGISEERLRAFTAQYRGKSVFDRVTIGAPREGHVAVDAISGATITVMVQNSTVMQAARRVAESRGLTPALAAARAAALPPLAPPPVTVPAARAPPSPATAATAESAATAPAATAPAAPLATDQRARAPAPPPEARAPAVAASPAPAGAPLPPVVTSAPEEPLWMDVWRNRKAEIALLVAGLATLAAILVFQDWLARQPTLLWYVRRGFLLYTLFFIGWYALAQLSIVHVFTFVHAVMRDFYWESFLIDPMIFILWGFVALTLLLWGRGVYCGWLCPFGALQELANHGAQRLGIRQLEFPEVVHERLWAVKYLVLILLFGVSLQSTLEMVRYAEIEPFKTAVTLRFQREWPFVLYAGALVAVSLVNRKFFCKYLCPLGAALAIPGRFRVFDWWLRRRRECGRPCQTCAQDCEVRAIRPTGEINANECHYCLDCQVTYYNEAKCMPLLERRNRHQRA
ncbi:MAG: 4Fe-4S binding protein, partial [Burkholderiales bacterium]|nr:4Fe-4S binding protein [Burkholderiales bacterium]